MEKAQFEIVNINNGARAINDHGRTVALVTQHGFIDWLLISPSQKGPLIDSIFKEVNPCYTLGLKFQLTCPRIITAATGPKVGYGQNRLVQFSHHLEEGGSRLRLVGEGRSHDRIFATRTDAQLAVTPDGERYEWIMRTVIANVGHEAQTITHVEYNNLYPSLAYRGILHGAKKEFDCNLILDRDGVIWRFPHQHTMHYGGKIKARHFGTKSWCGFFGSKKDCPVISLTASDMPLAWGICDMFYDLHCDARGPHVLPPGGEIAFQYLIHYLSPDEAATHLKASRPVEVTEEDRGRHDFPRLDYGLNRFDRPVHIDHPDEACCYRIRLPEKAWDREVGRQGKGSLRLTSQGSPVSWTNEPHFHAVNGMKLRVSAWIQLQDVASHGFHLRLQHYCFLPEPKTGCDPIHTVQSAPVTGTTDGWILITVPDLDVPAGEVEDGLVRLDLVLEDRGTVWVTDVAITIEPSELRPSNVVSEYPPNR